MGVVGGTHTHARTHARCPPHPPSQTPAATLPMKKPLTVASMLDPLAGSTAVLQSSWWPYARHS